MELLAKQLMEWGGGYPTLQFYSIYLFIFIGNVLHRIINNKQHSAWQNKMPKPQW